jgi:hypothetical protein
LRDEAIITTECIWKPPNFGQSELTQRVVTFKFPHAEQENNTRLCIMGLLTHYEYFHALFQRWGEGVSGVVIVTDTDIDAFDIFLSYIFTGQLDNIYCSHMILQIKKHAQSQAQLIGKHCSNSKLYNDVHICKHWMHIFYTP